MFLFPSATQDDLFVQLVQQNDKKAWASHNISLLHPTEGANHLRSLNVPFCINIMAGGQYSTGQLASFTSLSDKEHFHLEKNSQADIPPAKAHEQTETHQHDYFELLYVFDGEVEQYIENGHFLYTKGYACLMNRNTRHYEVMGENYFLVFLCLSKGFIRDSLRPDMTEDHKNTVYNFLMNNLGEDIQYKKDYLEFKPLSSEGHTQVNRVMEELTKELLVKQPGHTFMVVGLVARILACLQNASQFKCSHVVLDCSAEAYLFNKITQFIESRQGRVSRTELSEHLNYSSDYINRVVKKHSGMNLSEYNQLLCLKKAERLLTETKKSITSIIAEVGFENKTYFYKLFSKKHGFTPLEYRKRYQEASRVRKE